jgi:hypothetical protein
VVIIETSIFTRRVIDILTDNEYGELQGFMAAHPDAGNIIPGGRGLRKLRWGISGKGKRGGTRIIYCWLKARDTLLMVFIFRKNERSDLTRDQLKTLKRIAAKGLG